MAARRTHLARCLQVLLPLLPMGRTINPLILVPTSTPMVMVGCVYVLMCVCFSFILVHYLTLLSSGTDGSQSGAHFPSRAAEAVWPQWQGQQHSQSNAEQHPHAQGNQQDMFPVSDVSPLSFKVFVLSPSLLSVILINLDICVFFCFCFRMCCLCWTSRPTSTTMTLRFPSTLHSTSDLVVTSVLIQHFVFISHFILFYSSLSYI